MRGRTLLEEVLSVIDMKFSLFYFTTENQKKRKDKNTENTQMQCGEEAQKEIYKLLVFSTRERVVEISCS